MAHRFPALSARKSSVDGRTLWDVIDHTGSLVSGYYRTKREALAAIASLEAA